MNRYFLICFVSCFFTVHPMEHKSFSLSSFFKSTLQKIAAVGASSKVSDEYVYEKIQKIRDEKASLEDKLKLDWLTNIQKEYINPETL